MTSTQRVFIGTMGGLAAVCVKFLGQDYYMVVTQAANLSDQQITSYIVGYSILTPILAFLGGLVAWVTDEKNKLKLLAIGVAAPAMITTWAGDSQPYQSADVLDLVINSAYADSPASQEEASPILDGVRLFFGIGKEIERYKVVVAKYENKAEARQKASQINQQHSDLQAIVGQPVSGQYPVILDSYLTLSQAKTLKSRAEELGISNNIELIKEK